MQYIKFTAGRGVEKSSFFAGLYLRTPKHTRFWGWGKPSVRVVATPPAAPHDDRPWAGLGHWLRAAHQFFDSNRAEQTLIETGATSFTDQASPEAGPGRDGWTRKRRLRFVCNRHVIGFVFD